jgi:hypothetical protein
MNKSQRKLLLTLHTTVTGAWIGSVAAYLALVIAAMASDSNRGLASTWSTLKFLGWYVIVPAAAASLLSGLTIALTTPWGLFKHRWVVASLALTTIAFLVLLGHMPTVNQFASQAATAEMGSGQALRQGLKGELLHAGVGLLILLTVQALNVYKPVGLTSFGQRLPAVQTTATIAVTTPAGTELSSPRAPLPWGQIALVHVLILFALFVAAHLVLGGLPAH